MLLLGASELKSVPRMSSFRQRFLSLRHSAISLLSIMCPVISTLARVRKISNLEQQGQGNRLEPAGCFLPRGVLVPLIRDASLRRILV